MDPPPPTRPAATAPSVKNNPPRRRKNLTYSEKRRIIRLIEEGCTKVEAGRRFGVNESTVRGIYAKRDRVREHFANLPDSQEVHNARRSWNTVTSKMESLLKRYLDKQVKRNISVDTKEIQHVARQIYQGVATKWNVENPQPFSASRGWFARFKKRYDIKSVSISGEAASADKEQADQYPQQLKRIIDEGQYHPEQIFNMDETNFYWKTAPGRSFVVKSAKTIRGRKPMKQRYTLLLACNAAGDKLKPTVVHTARKPRSYREKNMKQLNVHWMRSKKGYVSGHLSIEWLLECFIPDVKEYCKRKNIRFHILLLLDNAPGHSPMLREMDPDVRVEFLPPNTTSLIQPLDQEVISVLKASYAARQFQQMREVVQDQSLVQGLLDSEEDESEGEGEDRDRQYEARVKGYYAAYTIKSSVDLMVSCWNQVNEATIHHGWNNILKLVREARQEATPEGDIVTAEEAVEEAAAAARGVFTDVSAADIEEMMEPPPLTAEEVMEEEEVLLAEAETDDQQQTQEPISPSNCIGMKEVKELLLYLMKSKHLLEQDSGNDIYCSTISNVIKKYEDLYRTHVNSMQQSKITSFFRSPSPSGPPSSDQDSPQSPQPGPSGLRQPNFDTSSDSEPEFEGFLDTLVEGRGDEDAPEDQ